MVDFNDFYIEYKGHPRFKDNTLIEEDVIRVIVQKWEMILFTNKGELLGDPNFGGNLNYYLHQTQVSASYVKQQLVDQISSYIPEIANIGYKLNVVFLEDPNDFKQLMVINFEIADYKVYAEIGNRYGK